MAGRWRPIVLQHLLLGINAHINLDLGVTASEFGEHGSLTFSVTRPNGMLVLEHTATDIDLWRDGEFVRPKWGIYRGLAHADELRPDEERVRFANFAVTPDWEPTSDCR